MLNRGNNRQELFHIPGDYEAFMRVMKDTLLMVSMRIVAYCLMHKHWHLVLSAEANRELSRNPDLRSVLSGGDISLGGGGLRSLREPEVIDSAAERACLVRVVMKLGQDPIADVAPAKTDDAAPLVRRSRR